MRRVAERVSAADAKQRILTGLSETDLSSKASMAYLAWPSTRWKAPQGAAFAVSRMARELEDAGLIRYQSRGKFYGWVRTRAGTAFLDAQRGGAAS